jgi:hypothetical protein
MWNQLNSCHASFQPPIILTHIPSYTLLDGFSVCVLLKTGQNSNLLLILVSTVILGFGTRDDFFFVSRPLLSFEMGPSLLREERGLTVGQ